MTGRLPGFILDHGARVFAVRWSPSGERLATACGDGRARLFDRDGRPLFTIGERGEADGQLNYPSHLFVGADHLYVNDTMNFRIQVFGLDGRHLVTFGKQGTASGYFAQPKGIEGPGIRKVEPKGTEGPDVRKKNP